MSTDDCKQDCKQGRSCRSCDELGLCQRRTPPCSGCAVPSAAPLRLAPGVLEGYRPGLLGTPAQRRELLRVARWAALGIALVAVGALAAGYLVGALL